MRSNPTGAPKKSKLSSRRWSLMCVDLLIILCAFFISWACLHRYIPTFGDFWWIHLLFTLVVNFVFLLVFRCYDSLWRYEESREYLMQFLALASGHGVVAVVNYFGFPPEMEYPQRLQLLMFLISLLVMWILTRIPTTLLWTIFNC